VNTPGRLAVTTHTHGNPCCGRGECLLLSIATVAGMFALLYLVGQALVYAAEIAAVRYARLWPRAWA
jgi:hypothetical protein